MEGAVRDSLRWLFREIQKSDLGIDGFVEIFDDNRKTHGRLFAVQLKTGPSYFKEPNEEGFLFRGKRKHLKYWLEFSLPVLVVLCDTDTRTSYWQHVSAEHVTRTDKGWTITIPRSQTLAPEHKAALFKLTEPPQPVDFIPLALFRLLVHKFPGIEIAQELETPHDFWGFDYMAKLSGDTALIAYVYKPPGASFSTKDVDEVLRKRNICARACGWDKY